jgi:hypothetical protein
MKCCIFESASLHSTITIQSASLISSSSCCYILSNQEQQMVHFSWSVYARLEPSKEKSQHSNKETKTDVATVNERVSGFL